MMCRLMRQTMAMTRLRSWLTTSMDCLQGLEIRLITIIQRVSTRLRSTSRNWLSQARMCRMLTTKRLSRVKLTMMSWHLLLMILAREDAPLLDNLRYTMPIKMRLMLKLALSILLLTRLQITLALLGRCRWVEWCMLKIKSLAGFMRSKRKTH